ncbi:hypothetical protein F4778DRAFT_451984 [Xylariomycetidae sp. FL2044]|nr:hypothetical protein F4778DRAFT_451984 [Xylariomycetidae sp. FL2044]
MEEKSTTTCAARMGDLSIFPPEIIIQIVAELTVEDFTKVLSANKYTYDTITRNMVAVIPFILGLAANDRDYSLRAGFPPTFFMDRPLRRRWRDHFLPVKMDVVRAIKMWKVKDVLEGTRATGELECDKCKAKTTWTDIDSGKVQCEKCFPNTIRRGVPVHLFYRHHDRSGVVSLEEALGDPKLCGCLLNLKAFREVQHQGRPPLLRYSGISELPDIIRNRAERWFHRLLYLYENGETTWEFIRPMFWDMGTNLTSLGLRVDNPDCQL